MKANVTHDIGTNCVGNVAQSMQKAKAWVQNTQAFGWVNTPPSRGNFAD